MVCVCVYALGSVAARLIVHVPVHLHVGVRLRLHFRGVIALVFCVCNSVCVCVVCVCVCVLVVGACLCVCVCVSSLLGRVDDHPIRPQQAVSFDRGTNVTPVLTTSPFNISPLQ